MGKYNKYRDFTENDFIVDPYFQDWAINEDGANDPFWDAFFKAHPQKKEAGENARNFLRKIVFKEDFPDENFIKASLAKHLERIEGIESSKVIDIRRVHRSTRWVRVAAIFVGTLLGISALLLYQRNKTQLITTEYGITKSAVLPDGSVVVLNANSTIKFSKDWSKNNSREVWLEGEAFFNVPHINQDTGNIQPYEEFIVHTGDLAVKVLGTSFDIRERRGKTEVVLQTGKIKISFNDKKTKDIIMMPGEMLAYNARENRLVITTTNAENFSAWKEKKLLLNDPTTAEIVEYLEDNFGKKITLENPELGKRKIEGPILLTNLDDALFILSTVLNTEIIKKDSTIIIRSR